MASTANNSNEVFSQDQDATSPSSAHETNSNAFPDSEQQPPSSSTLPFVPTLAITSPDNYGRIDPENESNLSLLTGVSDDGPRKNPRLHTMLPRDGAGHRRQASPSFLESSDGDVVNGMSPSSRVSPLLDLPLELIDMILSHLSPLDLFAASTTCRTLYALADSTWQAIIQESVPGVTVTSSLPCASFRELYAAHERLWFLPKYKLWFCDRDLTGKLILVRYDPRRNCIEGYQLLSGRSSPTFEKWEHDGEVIIHGFAPQIRLHLDKPILQFRVGDRDNDGGFTKRPEANRFWDEMPMKLDDRLESMYHNFLLAQPLEPEAADARLATNYPYNGVWPPPCIPTRHHVSAMRPGDTALSCLASGRPRKRSEVSDQAFRIRQWMEMVSAPTPRLTVDQGHGLPTLLSAFQGAAPLQAITAGGFMGAHLGDEVITYSTLDPALYTPTPTKPWRGIWVGDYSGHGCEFLLINQPDDPPATDEELDIVRQDSETDETWAKRRLDARKYRGRLEGIKLTGDPNVPRGEYTFVADDLGPGGFEEVLDEEPFKGTRVVRSKGHVAGTGFRRNKFIESRLILISHDRLAQYWVEFGHISFFERVDIDSLLKV